MKSAKQLSYSETGCEIVNVHPDLENVSHEQVITADEVTEIQNNNEFPIFDEREEEWETDYDLEQEPDYSEHQVALLQKLMSAQPVPPTPATETQTASGGCSQTLTQTGQEIEASTDSPKARNVHIIGRPL